ncbi:hypothetical protein HDV01_001232 [Terramyces sp. JEL0728]|nr:hypothetical protein HDV01_001232 [Terramyces sp. JEL0728]
MYGSLILLHFGLMGLYYAVFTYGLFDLAFYNDKFPLAATLKGVWYGFMFVFDFMPIVLYVSKVIQVYKVLWKKTKAKSTLLKFMFEKGWKIILYFLLQVVNTIAFGAVNDIQYYTDILGSDQGYIAMASFKNFILTVHRVLLLLCLEELKIITFKLMAPISAKSTSIDMCKIEKADADTLFTTQRANSIKWTL